MYQIERQKDSWLGLSIVVSVALHVAVSGLFVWWQKLVPDAAPAQASYYVDIVNLPVADPRSGSPVQSGNEEVPAASEQSRPVMASPQPVNKKQQARPDKTKPDSSESAAFKERMSKIEGKLEAQRQAAAFEALRKKVAMQGRVGMPRGNGSESGSDYTAYLHSRLKDAFRDTISYQSKNPFVMIRLNIDANGRIVRTKLEKSSGDKVFELSVMRAITLAEQTIVPPPGHTPYEGAFVFRPQGVILQ